jgi:Chalcone isomerase-like
MTLPRTALHLPRRTCLRVGSCALIWAAWPSPATLAGILPKPPSEVLLNLPQAVLRGSGRLSFLGLPIYDARLWVDSHFSPAHYDQHPLALELQYARKLQGALIAERSIAEIRKLQRITDAKARAWLAQLLPLFPDVKAGERITGIQHPGKPSRFYVNGLAQGEIKDADLTQAFFSIWFSPQTSEPKLRLVLLNPQSPK